ncbi:hypothetical protein JCM11251_007921 [Rhodosporidiobolus azoricus]
MLICRTDPSSPSPPLLLPSPPYSPSLFLLTTSRHSPSDLVQLRNPSTSSPATSPSTTESLKMAKVAKPKSCSNGSTEKKVKSTTSKKTGGGGGKKAPSAYQKFVKVKTEELKGTG